MSRNIDRIFSGGGAFAMIIGATEAPADATAYDAAANDFGNVISFEPANESEFLEVMGMYNGVLIQDDLIQTGHKLKFKLTCDEVGHQALRALFGAAAGTENATDTTKKDYTPLSGANSLTGYGRLQVYDVKSNATPRLIWQNFRCHCKCTTQPKFDGKYNTIDYEITVLGDVGTVTVTKDPNLA